MFIYSDFKKGHLLALINANYSTGTQSIYKDTLLLLRYQNISFDIINYDTIVYIILRV